MRINRFLASAGLGSRRACEDLVLTGRVTVNGHVCESLACRVAPGDHVKVDGRRISGEETVTIALNKPRGYLCTASDEAGRRTIFDLLPHGLPRLVHVGRLDKESEGLLILTNDGALAQNLTHPRYKVEKEYEVILNRSIDLLDTEKLLRGFQIEGGRAKMEAVRITGARRARVILRQGIKRQIRLMFYELGYEVERLVRVRIGGLTVEHLPPGTIRRLDPSEISRLGAAPPTARSTKG